MKRLLLLLLITLTTAHTVTAQEQDDDFSMLSAYKDFQNQASDFSLSFLRYRPRGYDNRMIGVGWNGILIENWQNGTPSWNVLGNLASLNQGSSSTWINTSNYKPLAGAKIAASISNRSYRHKIGAEYNHITKKSTAVVNVSKRWGESISIDGVSADAYSLFAKVAIEGQNNNKLEISLLYAPSERATQRASTAEGYALTGSNLYNSAWGWQGSTRRSVRQSTARQPIAIVSHSTEINHSTLTTTLSARVGSESTTGLSWQNAPNPYPDYFRYMPTYQTDAASQQMVADAWRDDSSVSQIDFQTMYNVNNNGQARYIIEQRVRRLEQYNLSLQINDLGNVSAGLDLSHASNRNFKRVDDLMGAQYWLDVDAFVEHDDDHKEMSQSNIRNPNHHAVVGDRFGYDYTMTMNRARSWIAFNKIWKKWRAHLTGNFKAIDYQRTGHFEKGNFGGTQSYGKSPRIHNYDYQITAQGNYTKGGKIEAQAMISYVTTSPSPDQLFLSPDDRSATLPRSISEKAIHAEVKGDYRSPGFRAHTALYFTSLTDGTDLMTFYDDNINEYTHYWLHGIGRRYAGIEFSTEFDLTDNLLMAAMIALSNNVYTNNPSATQWRESDGAELQNGETVYYENLHVSGSPQNVGVVALNYRRRQTNVLLTVNCFDGGYVGITPLRRTERTSAGLSKTPQEQLSSGATVDLFGGHTIRFDDGKSLGIWVGINNVFNNFRIRSGGYESYRTVRTAASASRYYYALGINGFISATLKF